MASKTKRITSDNKEKFVITRGVNRISISAACVFFACIRKNMSRTAKEIAELYKISEPEMNKGCKVLLKMLKTKREVVKIGSSKPDHFVKRYCDKMGIKSSDTNDAIKIAKNIEKLNIGFGHTPYSLAAASILIMSELKKNTKINKRRLSRDFVISCVTLSKTYKELIKYKHVLINDNIVDDIVVKMNKASTISTIPDVVLNRMKKLNIAHPQNISIGRIRENLQKIKVMSCNSDKKIFAETHNMIKNINNKFIEQKNKLF